MKFRKWLNEGRRELAQAYTNSLRGIPQDPIHHPEGDVLNHVRLVRKAIPQAIQELQRLQQSHPVIGPTLADLNFSLNPHEQQIVALAVWLHDIGKITATAVNPKGKIQALQHHEPTHYEAQLQKLREIAPQETVDLFVQNEPLIRFLIERHMDLVRQGFPRHFMANYFANGKFKNMPEVKLLLILTWADKMGRTPESIAAVLEKTVAALTDSIHMGQTRERNIAKQSTSFGGSPEQFAQLLAAKPMTKSQKVQAMRGKYPNITDVELSRLIPEAQEDKLLIIMRGVSGSGKSTKARALAGTNGAIFATDDFWGPEYNWDRARLPEAHNWNQERVKKAMAEGRSPIVVDNMNIQAWEAKPYVQMAQQFGYRVEFHEPDTDIWKRARDANALLQRVANDLAALNTHGVPAETIASLIAQYAPIDVQKVLASTAPWEKNQGAI